MKFLDKRISDFGIQGTYTYKKPAICPHCLVGTDAPITSKGNFQLSDGIIVAASCRCTACGKIFFFAIESQSESHACKQAALYPPISETFESDLIAEISPGFIAIYNQSLRAESNGDIDLAATGFRMALEHMVKDYAIAECGADQDEVAGKKLIRAISDYLGETDLVKTADVIRILGNDYAHYTREYPSIDFLLMKKYMEIFITLIEAKLLVKHPPVER